jgi:crotonobetainyl-CoA:carnitine CoA-transferase CaiB-like acyl-CoA transferase
VTVDFLQGLRVLELGDGVAGASTSGLLAALGAEVTSVVDPASPHRRGRPTVASGATEVSLLGAVLDRGKHLVSAEDLRAVRDLLDGPVVDLVIFDRVGPTTGPLASLRELGPYLAFVAEENRVAWLTISAFGLSGPRAKDTATELTVAAASGMLASVRDEQTRQPLKLGGQQSLLNTGQAAALAACHAVDLAADGQPVHLDLSAVEATLAMGPVLEVGGLLLETASVGGAKRYGAPASFYPCTDGLVRISAMEDHQWRGVVTAMGSPSWAERFATVDARIEAPDEVDNGVAEWTRRRTKREAETELQAHGVPATAVYSPAEILGSPQLAHRGAFEALPIDGGHEATVVGLPFTVVVGGNAERPARRRRRSLRGLRMVEASRVLAVPLAGALLGSLGAIVNKLEDLPRLDMYRRRGPYVDGEAGPERSAYFALMNHTKGSVAFDIDADLPRLDTLLTDADVIIENLGPKRATALGMAASVAPVAHPDVLAVSSSGFGQDGPHADYRAYAYNLQASGALGYLTRNHQGESAEIDIAWADLISAYALATIIAAWAVGPSGNAGAGVDFSMTDLVVSHFNEYLAAASLDRDDDSADRANDLAPFAPHGVYATTDGWLAVAVAGDEQYARLVACFGESSLSDPRFETSAGRLKHRRDLDERVGKLVSQHASVTLAERLRTFGVAAEPAVDAAALIGDRQLEARGFFARVDHPEWGNRPIVGVPWRRYGSGPLELSAAPLLGAHRLRPEEPRT